MASLAHYYSRARGGLLGISPAAATDLAEDWAVAGLMGAALGAIASQAGGLDKKFGGMVVPLDGLAAAACALTGLSMHNKQLQTASIAAIGSASTRIFTRALSKGKVSVTGEIESAFAELPIGSDSMGWGAESHDRLVEAAKYL
jgi:hypothetical protein